MAIDIRPATTDERAAVRNVIDGAALAVGDLSDALAAGSVLVAVAEGRMLGALVLDGHEITAIAVRRRRRGQGIGTALVEDALARRSELVAECDAGVAEFWRAVGFEMTPRSSP